MKVYHPGKHPRLSRFIGNFLPLIPYLWNRLKCPRCEGIGTFAPHGHWADFMDTRRVPRWLCKWCGFYWSDSEGEQCAVIANLPMWELRRDVLDRADRERQHIRFNTPRKVVFDYFGTAINPWRK